MVFTFILLEARQGQGLTLDFSQGKDDPGLGNHFGLDIE